MPTPAIDQLQTELESLVKTHGPSAVLRILGLVLKDTHTPYSSRNQIRAWEMDLADGFNSAPE